ncbi:MAG: MlaD family protein [Planctomycetota bacterium]
MKEQRRNVMVGLFMIAGLAALGTLMVLFGEASGWLGGREWPLEIQVTELRGAPEGTPVTLNGIQVGRVGILKFASPTSPGQGVTIVALIKDQYVIPRGASAVIYAPELGIGRGRIEILVAPDSAKELLPRENARISGKMGSMIHEIVPETLMSDADKMVIQIGNFAEALTPVADDLHEIFKRSPMELVDDPAQAKRMTANLYTVIQRFDKTLKHFNDVLGDPNVKSGLRDSVENIRRITEDGRLAMTDLRESAATVKDSSGRIATKIEGGIDQATADVDEISRKLMPTLDNLAAVTSNLNRVSQDLADGQGSAGKFLRDDRLYEKLVLFTDTVTDLINTVRRIADKTERQGYLDVAAKTPVGKVPGKMQFYDPNAVTTENER